jgi:predicted dehydrogenase/sugar phosphate isomerase/epimerase
MGANFVARESDYQPRHGGDWGSYDAETQAAFRPLGAFRSKFCGILDSVVEAGFSSLDLWTAHLHYEWATPEHVAVAIEETTARRLRISSYAGGFGATVEEFRACCRLAEHLRIRILGGGSPLLESDRGAFVRTLREFGLFFALENHPEKSPEEILARIGEADADVLGVAVDTGWFGTQGFPADEAVRVLLPRTRLVHLKDVRAAGAHETCPFGEGVVPVESCLQILRLAGYRGGVSIEHEPFDNDPLPACKTMLTYARNVLDPRRWRPHSARRIRAAIIGCGNISAAYGDQLAGYPEIALHAVTDVDPARARAFEQTFGPRAYPSLDGLIADADVELVINLTIHSAHYEVIAACLDAGKHVYTEKPLATASQLAHQLVALAAKKDLRLGSAPSTWLGEAQATAWRHIRAGAIGAPRVAIADVNWGRIESWHPNPGPFYSVGPVFDVAVYPITLLTAWFGPVRSAQAGGGILYPHRRTKEGVPFTVESEDWTCAILRHETGVYSRITSSFYVGGPDAGRGLEIHGDEGSLYLSRWDEFDARLLHAEFGHTAKPVVLDRLPARGIEFARGAQDLAQAMLEGRPHRCSGTQAAHVVEVCEAVLTSAREGRRIEIVSSFPKPALPA